MSNSYFHGLFCVHFITTPGNVRANFLSGHDHRWSHPSVYPLRSIFVSIPISWEQHFVCIVAQKPTDWYI